MHTGTPTPTPVRPCLLHTNRISNGDFQNSDIWAEDGEEAARTQPYLPCGFPSQENDQGSG